MQLLLEQDTNELERYIVLYQALGLPTTLAEMQMDSLNDQELLAIGIQATLPNETIHRMPFKITAEEVANAFQAVDAYVTKNFSQRKKIDFYFFPCYFVYKLKKEGRRHDKQQLCIGMLLLYGAKSSILICHAY